MKQSCVAVLTFHLVLTVQYAASETYREWYDNTVRNCTPGSTIKYYKPNKVCTCTQPGVVDSCRFLGIRYVSETLLREPARTTGKARSIAEWKPKKPCITRDAPVFDGCNWCGCDGGRFTCTKNPCVKKLNGELNIESMVIGPGGVININYQGPEKCTAKTYQHDDECNWCTCTNGWTLCTIKYCDPKKKTEINKCINNPEGGYMSDDGCNWCSCTPDNNAICTRRRCFKESKDVKKKKMSIKEMCMDNEERGFLSEDGCNWCICTPDNSDAICTRRGCSKDAKEKKKSIMAKCKKNPKVGYLHDDGCNWCTCTRDKSNAFCTKGACKDNSKNNNNNKDLFPAEDKKKPKKTPDTCVGKLWGRALMSDGCNTCTCLFGKSIICTNMLYCPESVVTLTKKSRDPCKGKRWGRVLMADGCNTCSCENGKITMCTIMNCPEPVATLTKKLSSSICKNGLRHVKPDQCNVCLCDDSAVAKCTMKYCLGENTGSDKKKDKTLQGIKHKLPMHSMKLYALKEKAQSCKVGEKFKQPYASCNWCTCVEDGVVTCDTEVCPGDLSGSD